MNQDETLQHDVLAELRWDPEVDPAGIGVAVSEGIVTLTGFVPSYGAKVAAEKAVSRVAGVRGLAEELVVHLGADHARDDASLARQILDTLDDHAALSGTSIQVKVSAAAVTLSGSVSWRFQRETAAKAITHIHGIRSIANLIEVHNPVSVLDVRDGIEAAFLRMADLDIGAVAVAVDGSRVILTGSVHSLYEANIARAAAWASPGVTDVEDRIRVLG